MSTVEPMESKEINETSTLIASSSPQIESIMLNNGDDTMPNVDVKEKSSKGSYKLTKKKKEKTPKEKKPNFFTSIFRSNDRKSKTPALDLPAVERDLNVPGETPVLNLTSSKTDEKIDPLHVPNVDLPQLDVQLPKFDQPEVKSIELTVPAVELPPIADLDLPKDEKKSLEISSIELVQIPAVELPEVQYKTDENQPFVLPEIHLKSSKESIAETPEVVVLPTLENGLALASPVNDLLDIQVNHSEFPVETDYAKTPIVADVSRSICFIFKKNVINRIFRRNSLSNHRHQLKSNRHRSKKRKKRRQLFARVSEQNQRTTKTKSKEQNRSSHRNLNFRKSKCRCLRQTFRQR